MAGNKQKTGKKKFNGTAPQPAKKLSRFIKPMLAKEVDEPFDNKDWIFEIKWDGYRAISEINNGEVQLYSRNGNSFNSTYPIVYNELKKIKQNMVLDGEIVVLDENGKSHFQKLQHYEENTQYPICYYVFDILSLNGKDTTDLPLLERKKILKGLIKKSSVIKYSDHVVGEGNDFFCSGPKAAARGHHGKKGQ